MFYVSLLAQRHSEATSLPGPFPCTGSTQSFMLGLRTALGKLQRGGEQIQGVLSTPCAEGSSWLSLSPKSPVRRESRVFSSPPCVPGTVCQRWELLPRESPRPETCLQCLDRSQARSSSWSTEKIQGLGRWTAALTRTPAILGCILGLSGCSQSH